MDNSKKGRKYTPAEDSYIIKNFYRKEKEVLEQELNRSFHSIRDRVYTLRAKGIHPEVPDDIVVSHRLYNKKPEMPKIKLGENPLEYKRQDVTIPGFEVGVKVIAKVDGAFGDKAMRGVIIFKNNYFITVDFGQYRQSYLWQYVKRGDVKICG